MHFIFKLQWSLILIRIINWIFDKNMFYYLLNNSFLWVKIWVKYIYNVEIYFTRGKPEFISMVIE